jgi:succinate dehydrogenase / fumarate reductase iron-sulfur subunit
MESDPDFLGPAALAKGFRFVGDARDGATIERLERYSEEHGIWDCTRCYGSQALSALIRRDSRRH